MVTVTWPRDIEKVLIDFYGMPGSAELEAQLVKVIPPFQMYYGGKPISSIKFHKKAAPALQVALQEIWDKCGHDQKKVDALRLSVYDGAYNPRKIAGSNRWSNHAFGAAIDIDAEHNGFNTGHGTMPQLAVDAFKHVGFRWGGDYKGRTDPMHFEACGGGTFTVDAPVVVPPEPSLIPKPPELPPIPKPPPVSRELPVLQLGSKGEDVEYVQLLLFVDGIFGKVTEQAVKDFQKSEGLTVDGIVGPNTWKALLKEEVPPAVSVPHPEVKGRQMNITATVFGGAADPNDSAYTGEPLNDTDLYVALPYRLKGDRPKVRVFANGKTVEASIEDIGPWNVDDDYPSKNTRPVAETCYANKTPLPSGPNKGKVPRNDAGIDLSPETARRLSISGKDKVDWEFVGVTTT